MLLQPEGTKVIIKPDIVDEASQGGIYFPDTSRDKQQAAVTRGTIVAIGPLADIQFDSGKAKVGDKVVFARYGYAAYKIDKVEYRILHDTDIHCLILGEVDEKIRDEELL